MTSDATRLRVKTWICTLIVVFSNAFGDFFMKRGMPEGAGLNTPLQYIAVLFQPWVTLGVVLLIVWQLSRMALLSWADLSYVLPVTSAGYVLAAIAGRVFLQEQISAARWIGVRASTAPATRGRSSLHCSRFDRRFSSPSSVWNAD